MAEHIDDVDFVFRNVHFTQHNAWNPSRRPNETDFRFDDDGLSVTWEKLCDINETFILLGLQKNFKGRYRDPEHFKVIKFNVGDIRGIVLSNEIPLDVKHTPQADNPGHASVVCDFSSEEDKTEARLKLCDLAEKSDPVLHQPDYKEVNIQLLIRRVEI